MPFWHTIRPSLLSEYDVIWRTLRNTWLYRQENISLLVCLTSVAGVPQKCRLQKLVNKSRFVQTAKFFAEVILIRYNFRWENKKFQVMGTLKMQYLFHHYHHTTTPPPPPQHFYCFLFTTKPPPSPNTFLLFSHHHYHSLHFQHHHHISIVFRSTTTTTFLLFFFLFICVFGSI